MKKEKLVVIVRGGVVQSVLSSSLEYPIEVKVLDYDDSSYMTKQEQKEQKELIKKLEEEIKDYYPIY